MAGVLVVARRVMPALLDMVARLCAPEVFTGLAVRVAGMAWPTAAGAALLLAQVGEFSFVLEGVGRFEGLSPLDLGSDGSQAFIAATVVLMILTPALAAAGSAVEERLARRTVVEASPLPLGDGEHDRHGHVIVAGYGSAARATMGGLRRLGAPSTILTRNPGGAAEASEEGHDVIIGDYAKRHVLEEAGIRRARLLIVADDDLERTEQVTELARSLSAGVAIVTRPLGEADVAELAWPVPTTW